MKEKMDAIQIEMSKFNESSDRMVRMCDREMRELMRNIDRVTKSMEAIV